MPGKRAANPPKVRGHSAIAQSHPDLAQVIVQTVRLWRKAHLDYDQTKYVVEQVRRRLRLDPPRTRRCSVERLDRAEVERLISSGYQLHSKYGLMIKTLFYTGACVDAFVHLRVEDVHFESEPPQVHLTHAKGQASRYVPILPSLAQELRTHLQGRRQGYLFESNRHTHYSIRMVQAVIAASAARPASGSGSIRTCSATRSPPSCSIRDRCRSIRCRSSWGTCNSRPRRFTPKPACAPGRVLSPRPGQHENLNTT